MEENKTMKSKVKFIIKEITIEKESIRGTKVEEHSILIGMKHTESGFEKIHNSFTAFIFEYWRNTSPNTRYKRAQHLISFLNWVLNNKDRFKGFKDFTDLTFEIATDYLNNYGLDVGRDSVQDAESTLTYFYYYMASNELLKQIKTEDFTAMISEDTINKNRHLPKIQPPFKGVKLPVKKIPDVLHSLPKPVLPILFQVCENHTPDITLALALGMFGGVRNGGLITLNRTAVIPLGKNGEEGFLLDIKHREFRGSISIKTKGTPKKPRKQVVDSNLAKECLGEGKLQLIYANHMLRYKCNDDSGALFVDSNGNAMTTETFYRRFAKLKKMFFKTLSESEDIKISSYAHVLQESKWSTHIFRGIFSNLKAEKTDNPILLQVARGDSNPQSSLTYITDTDKQKEQLKEITRDMYKEMFQTNTKQSFKAKKKENIDG